SADLGPPPGMIEARRHGWRRASESCGGAGISPGAGCSGAVSVLVRLADGSRDAAAVRDVVALPAGPRTDSCGVSGAPAGAAGAPGATAAHAARLLDPGGQVGAQRSCVLLGQVDLVGDAVEGEAHGLVRLGAIGIIDELHIGLSCHEGAPILVWIMQSS